MPFTLSHPAFVLPLLPLTRRWLVFSALVVGSMAPDFGYFFPGGYVHSRTHTLGSAIWFCLPASLVVWWLFQVLVKRALVELSPDWFRSRLIELAPAHPGVRLRGLHWVLLSLLLGIGSHLLVDACTHKAGFFVQLVPGLKKMFVAHGSWRLNGYRVLQHGFSFLGLIGLLVFAGYWLRKRNPAKSIPGSDSGGIGPLFRWLLLLCLVLVPLITTGLALPVYLATYRWRLALGHSVVAGLAAFGLELLLLGICWRLARLRVRVPGEPA
jgi:hypothetical protein